MSALTVRLKTMLIEPHKPCRFSVIADDVLGANQPSMKPIAVAPQTRAKYAFQEGVSRLERLTTGTSKRNDAKNEAAKTLFKNVTKSLKNSIMY
jgi:hypothetical protein